MSASAAIPAKAPAKEEGIALPVTVVCLVILVVWYIAAIPMNWVVTEGKIAAAGGGPFQHPSLLVERGAARHSRPAPDRH